MQIVDARKKCPNLMAVHVATYKEGDSEPQYWENPSSATHKVSSSRKGTFLDTDMVKSGLFRSLSS
jgi:hypothetical protein